MLDVRFLPNPYFVAALSALTGEDDAVARFVLDDPDAQEFLEQSEKLLQLSVAGSSARGRHTSRSRSAARAAVIARSRWRKSWRAAWARISHLGPAPRHSRKAGSDAHMRPSFV